MKTKEKSGKLLGLAAAVLLTAVLVFTGCPNAAGGNSGGSITPPASAAETYTVGGISFTMKGIAAVTNGSVGDNSQSDNNVHTVSLTAYRIGETEVTQELWEGVMGTNPSFFDNTGNKALGSSTYDTSPASGEVQEKRPVEQVSWYDCIVFCNELTKRVAGLGESQCVYSVEGHIYTKEDAENNE